MKKRIQPRPQLDMFQPKPLKMEDIDWVQVFRSPDFQRIGLCDDPERRSCYLKPVILDPERAPYQGLPYVMELKTQPERELNDLLWQIEVLSQREHSLTARIAYQWAIMDPNRSTDPITPEAHFEQRVRMYHEAGLYPKVWLAAIPQRAPGEPEPEDEFGNPIADELSRFFSLDFVGQVIYGLEQHAQWIRQGIYYERAVAQHATEQRIEHERLRDKRAKHWGRIDKLREEARNTRLKLRQANPELVAAPKPESEFENQMDLFQ
jgi:hypothetical protein